MNYLGNMTRKDLLSLPRRNAKESIYNSIAVLPIKRKHESGYGKFLVIGVNYKSENKFEIISDYSDDIEFINKDGLQLRQECFYKNNAIHYWSNYASFKIGSVASSFNVVLIEKKSS